MKKKAVLTFLLAFLVAITLHTGCKKSEEKKVPETPPATGPAVSAPSSPDVPQPGNLSPIPPAPVAVPGTPTGKSPLVPPPADIVYAARFTSAGVGIPQGWELDRKSGTPSVRIEPDGDKFCLHLISDNETSYGIKRGVKVDIHEYPFLNWRWRVTKMPKGGNVKNSITDDQALQIYTAFPATGWPAKLNTPIIGYIWDNEAPKGWTGRSAHLGAKMLRYVVVRNGADRTGEWYTEKRNILSDYKKLFSDVKGGQPLGPTQGIEIYINSQHTGSSAESTLCDVFFSRN